MKCISISLVLIALSSSLNSFAAFPAINDQILIDIPEFSGGFFAGVSGNFLQPAAINGDLDYTVISERGTVNQHKTSDVSFNGPYVYLVFHI